MDKQIKLIKRIWKTGAIGLVVMTMTAGGLFLNLKAASANPAPNMTINHQVSGPSSSAWSDSVNLNAGDTVHFYAEIHNTVVDSTAVGVVISATMPTGTFVDGSSVATVRTENANTASDNASIHVTGGGRLELLPGTTRITWDVNGDGNKEYDNTFIAGSPLEGSGILLGDQKGCNQYIIQVGWSAKVVGEQTSPSPTPTPTPTPAPPTGGQNQEQNQEQTQNNEQNQTVNVSNTNTNTVNVPAVQGVSVPLKQPDTGVSVLGLASMFGAAPVGIAMSRFGKGRRVVGKREEENLAELGKNLVDNRIGKSQDA